MSSLPILMYHNVVSDPKKSKGLTISTHKLEEQFKYLTSNNFKTFHLAELNQLNQIPAKSIVLTFDDVTKNQLEYAVPLLQKYNLKATFFIPFKYVGGFDDWNEGTEPIMDVTEIQNLPQNIELAYHTFAHNNLAKSSITEVEADFNESNSFVAKNNLNLFSAIAYPYGQYPKKDGQHKESFFNVLKQNNITFGLRIGNRLNKFPFKNPYEVMRIDVLGEDSLFIFKLKLKFGKLKPF